MNWTSGAATDTGLVRERNEDRYWIDSERGIYLVVDGVGGQAAGEIAAQTAVETIREWIGDMGDPETRVRRAIAAANNRIWQLSAEEPGLSGMACVLTLAIVEDDRLVIGHVGDSRLYLIRHGAIRKLTRDHSPVGEGEDSGELSELEAMHHPRRNEVYREVGASLRKATDVEFIETRECRLRRDAALLLCSDGLTDQVTSDHIREIAERYAGDAELIARELVAAANEAGGSDNITALFVAGPAFHSGESATRPRLSATRSRLPVRILRSRMAFLIYGLLLGMLLWAALRTRGIMP
jgi:serine/threonine protein phosphatase PrpC